MRTKRQRRGDKTERSLELIDRCLGKEEERSQSDMQPCWFLQLTSAQAFLREGQIYKIKIPCSINSKECGLSDDKRSIWWNLIFILLARMKKSMCYTVVSVCVSDYSGIAIGPTTLSQI